MTYKEKLYIDDLDGAVTLFKSTDEETETIGVFDEEHREVIEYLVKEINRYHEWWNKCKNANASVYSLNLAIEYINSLDIDGDHYGNWLEEINEEKWWRYQDE